MTGEREHIMALRGLNCILVEREALKVVRAETCCVSYVSYVDLLSFESDHLFCLKSPLVPRPRIHVVSSCSYSTNACGAPTACQAVRSAWGCRLQASQDPRPRGRGPGLQESGKTSQGHWAEGSGSRGRSGQTIEGIAGRGQRKRSVRACDASVSSPFVHQVGAQCAAGGQVL